MKKRIVFSASMFFMLMTIISGYAQKKPNIILIFPDNLGVGEVGAYGGARGVPTPNIDRIGEEGMRLTNFNVEYSCTPSRIAILTGRYAVRAGTNYNLGMTLWEETLAERLKSQGYSTALFGKWHVGGPQSEGKREPTHQGFDEWYGIPESSHVSQYSSFEGFDPKTEPTPYIWEGVAGSPSKKVKPYDLETRRTIDREAAEHSVAFMEKNVKEKKPFFLYYPMTQIHFPSLPHPDKAGTTGSGDIGDAMADVDYNVGIILKALKRLGIDDNTLVIWCTDNGAEMRRPWRGSPGPWRGYYNSAMEGGIRTPCVIRWPGKIPAGQVSNEIVHQVDLFPTIAAAIGAPQIVPKDRVIDGVDQYPFLTGKQSHSNRENAIFMSWRGDVMAVKWRDWKFWYDFKTEMPDPEPDNLTRLFDLGVDPREEIDVKDYYPWVIGVMDKIVGDYEASLKKYPRVERNSEDPYLPPPAGSGEGETVYSRTDRTALGNRADALPNPDFSGTWSTTVLHTSSPIGRVDKPAVATLGSGWGDKISIVHKQNLLEIEKVMFVPRENQSLVRYRFALTGEKSEIPITLGRTEKNPTATTAWDGSRLVITTLYPFKNKDGQWLEGNATQTMWLQPANSSPWEPTLVVETSRGGILGGLTSVNRTVYTKGYR